MSTSQHIMTGEEIEYERERQARDLAQLARIGGREYTRRLADLVARRQPISYRELDQYVATDASSLALGLSYQSGSYSQPWAWQDTEGGEHLDAASYHGLTHVMSRRQHPTTVPEAAFDWPIYVAGIGRAMAIGQWPA